MYFFHNLKQYVQKRRARERRRENKDEDMRTMRTMKASLQDKVASLKEFEQAFSSLAWTNYIIIPMTI
jgi:hypothetical protein